MSKPWSKEAKRLIWVDTFGNTQEANCPYCGRRMCRSAYEGDQPSSDYAWNVDHIDSNPSNNCLDNLQPMHPWCNREKN